MFYSSRQSFIFTSRLIPRNEYYPVQYQQICHAQIAQRMAYGGALPQDRWEWVYGYGAPSMDQSESF